MSHPSCPGLGPGRAFAAGRWPASLCLAKELPTDGNDALRGSCHASSLGYLPDMDHRAVLRLMIKASRVPVLAGGVKARYDLCRREMDVEKRPQRLEAQGVDGAAGRQQVGSRRSPSSDTRVAGLPTLVSSQHRTGSEPIL